MENADFEKFKERIKKEGYLFRNLSFKEKGFEDAQREALQWSYAFFKKYKKAFGDKQYVKDFTSQEIEELYSYFRSRQNTRVIRVNRIEGEQGFEGVYRIVEEMDYDPLEDASSAERVEYLKGWVGGIDKVWRIARQSMF